MTVVAEYKGEWDPQKHNQIITASHTATHQSIYHTGTDTHQLTFRCPQEEAKAMRDRLAATGIEFSRLEIVS